MAADDAGRIFTGIGRSYDRVATVLSLGQDPKWRSAAVDWIAAEPTDKVLDVATGTGMVALELRRRYGCAVVGVDQSKDMLAVARRRSDVYEYVLEAHAEQLPFADASFDHLTFTYLLRYVDDPAATMRELSRVLKPGGRMAMVEFGLPGPLWRPAWWFYTRIGLRALGRGVSAQWSRVGGFLGPSISNFWHRNPPARVEKMWRDAGLADVRTQRMSLGGGVVMTAVKAEPVAAGNGGSRGGGRGPGGGRAPGGGGRSPGGSRGPDGGRGPDSPSAPPLAPAFYARRGGGWRDYWTLLHPPYTLWHLSYVLLGAAIAPSPDPKIVAGALLAFGLAVGVAAHSFDELAGRPLRTEIPSSVLIALGSAALAGAVAIGLVGATMFGLVFLALVAVGAAIVLLYGVDAPLVHSDLGFALGWGAFPVVATGYACGAHLLPIALAAAAAALLSLSQRHLSTRARTIRRRAAEIAGQIVYADGSREVVDANSLISAPEAALSTMWLAILAAATAALLSRWL